MAWDQIYGNQGYTGDEPMDAFGTALERIAESYVVRFGRLPTLHELFYTFEIVLKSHPEEYVYDYEKVQEAQNIWTNANSLYIPIIPDDFQAAWCEETEPDGSYLVEQISTNQDVLKCILEITGNILAIKYEILNKLLTDADSQALIISTILKDFTDNFYADKVNKIFFVNILNNKKTGLMPYPKIN